MFHKDVDCIVNGSPHAKEANEFKEFFETYDSSENSFFVRTYIMNDLFQKVEKLQEDKMFVIDDFKSLLVDSVKIAEKLTQNIDVYSDKLDNKKLINESKTFDKSTQEHYGNLFKNFSEYHYYEEAVELLHTRLNRNNIQIQNIENKIALDDGCGGGTVHSCFTKTWF